MLYLAIGKNEFLREEFVGQLKTLMRRLPMGEHNIDEFGPPATVAEVISACAVTPFLCEKRMVIARGLVSHVGRGAPARAPRARAIAGPRAPAFDPAGELAAYLPRLPATTHLVLVEDEPGPLQPIASARPDAIKREFPPLREDALPGWIMDRARRCGGRISRRAAQELAQLAGPDLRSLDQEIAKLASYVDPGATMEVADLRELVQGGGPGLFAFHDALAERRPAAALSAARWLMAKGDDPAELLAQISGLVRRLLVVKELTAQGRPLAQEASTFGLTTNRYALDKLQRQATSRSMADLEQAYGFLRDVDIGIKTGRLDPELAIELATAEIAGILPPKQNVESGGRNAE